MEPVFDPKWFPNRGEMGEWALPDEEHLTDIIQNIIDGSIDLHNYKPAERAKELSWASSAKNALDATQK